MRIVLYACAYMYVYLYMFDECHFDLLNINTSISFVLYIKNINIYIYQISYL